MKHLLLRVRYEEQNVERDRRMMLGACAAAGAHVRAFCEHQFVPHGYSCALVLAESHATLHTWPEDHMAVIDYFSCAHEPNVDAFVEAVAQAGYPALDERVVQR